MMKCHKAFSLAGVVLVSVVLGGFGISGCGGGNSIDSASVSRGTPSSLYGQWHLVSITGGITGQGEAVAEQTIDRFEGNQVRRTIAGQLVSVRNFQVVRQSTLFGAPKPVLEYLPLGEDIPLVITRLDATHLTLSGAATDGFQYDYERVP